MPDINFIKGGDYMVKNRAEKARIYREYVQANAEAGIESDPAELDRIRMSMAGGDPFGASMIPAGDALKKLTEEANSRAQNAQMKTQTERWAMKDTERTYVQRVVDDNWDKSPEDMSKVFENAFGPEHASRIYDAYKPELSSMLSESTAKKYANFHSDPRSKLIFSDEDVLRMYPAESRNPQTMNVLKSIAKDNSRARNQQDFKSGMDILRQTPDFVPSSPEAREWWKQMSANGMGYNSPSELPNPQMFNTGQELAFTQAQAAQQAKVTELAAKDPFFDNAAKTGDEEAIFVATTSLMVQAGMPAPKDKNDPTYLAIKKNLELVSRTAAVREYNKKEADITAAVIQEADEMKKGQKARMEANALAAFLGKEYSNGKSGKDAAIDERIGATLSLINNDPSFFGSPENIKVATDFIKKKYLTDKKAFDPNAVYGEFMATGPVEAEAQWVKRRVNSQVEGNGLLKPGANFKSQMEERKTVLTDMTSQMFTKLNQPAKTQVEYEDLMNKKAKFVAGLRTELNDIKRSVNTLNNDPAIRTNVVGFDYQSSLRDMEILENSIQQIERFNPVPPDVQKSLDDTSRSLQESKKRLDEVQGRLTRQGNSWGQPQQPQQPKTVTVYEPLSYETTVTNVPRSRLDTYLDAVADAESSGDPFARAATSSASGLFQFTRGTWNSLVEKFGERLGITKDDIFNPHAQRIMAQVLTMQNAEQLIRQTGRDPNEGDLYLAHFLGPARAATVINHQGSSLLAANLFPDAAKANRGIFYKDGVPVTVEELYKTMSSKLKRRMKSDA